MAVPLHILCTDTRPRPRLGTLDRLLDYPCWRNDVCGSEVAMLVGSKRASRAAAGTVSGLKGQFSDTKGRRRMGAVV